MKERQLIVRCKPVEIGILLEPTEVSLKKGSVHAHFATLTELRDRSAFFIGLLDQDERARADRFKFEVDRERYILGHGHMRELLGQYLAHDPAAVTMERGPYGKPFIRDSHLQFNLSDTKDAVLVAFTLDHAIGADVETMTRRVDHVSVGQYYFTPEEILSIEQAPDGKRRFLEFWTRKEAVLKASGVGIMEDLRVLRVDGTKNVNTISHKVFVDMAADEYHVRTWRIGDDHLVSLALNESGSNVRLFNSAPPHPRPKNAGGN